MTTPDSQETSHLTDPYYHMTAVKYARVSTDDKGQTTASQIRYINEWGKLHSIIWVGDEEGYCDEKSGNDLDRPRFNEMIGMIAQLRPNLLVSYDVSRLTRNNEVSEVERMIEPFGCHLAFVTVSNPVGTLAGDLQVALTGVTAKHENIERSVKTSMGMMTRKLGGNHVARPLALAFKEDIGKPEMLDGLITTKLDDRHKRLTTIITEEQFYSFAHRGFTLPMVADSLGISYSVLINAITLPDGNPSHRYRGLVDRRTPYLGILASRKGMVAERVEKPEISVAERVGGERCRKGNALRHLPTLCTIRSCT